MDVSEHVQSTSDDLAENLERSIDSGSGADTMQNLSYAGRSSPEKQTSKQRGEKRSSKPRVQSADQKTVQKTAQKGAQKAKPSIARKGSSAGPSSKRRSRDLEEVLTS